MENREVIHVRSETEIVLIVMLPQTKECQELLEAERSKEGFSSEPSSLQGSMAP